MRLARPLAISFAPALVLALVLASACSDGEQGPSDSGVVMDALDDFDAGVNRDAGPDAGRIDAGKRDIGFDDPATIIQGVETIEGLDTFIHAQGTLTSTLPPIFLIHTGPQFGHEYWPPHMRFLLPSRLLVYYDVRAAGRSGFGSSATTTTVTADQHALDVEDLRLYMGTRGANVDRIDLIGHGYGSGIAALYAAAHPNNVAHLILTNPYPATARQLALFKAEAASRVTSTELELINQLERSPHCRGNPDACEIEIWQFEGAHYLCEANRPLWRNLIFEYGSPRCADFVELELRSMRYDWRPILATITAPTTIISGPCDPTPPETALTYTSSISGAVHHVLPNSGHFPFVEQPAEYQQLVLEALRR